MKPQRIPKPDAINQNRERFRTLVGELRANADEAQADRLNELEDLLNTLSDERYNTMLEFIHEHNNAFGLIRGYHTLLADIDVESLSSFQVDALKVIGEQIERLNYLIDDFYKLIRLREGHLEFEPAPVKLKQALTDIPVENPRLLPHWESLQTQIPDDLPDLWADRAHLIHALTLLVVKVIGVQGKDGDRKLRISTAATPAGVQIWVGDMPSKAVSTMTDVWQLGSCYTAFHLALHLIDCMKGSPVTVEQTPGGSSVFSFTMPTVPAGDG